MDSISQPFSRSGSARAKLLLLAKDAGAPAGFVSRLRSLHLEHLIADALPKRSGIPADRARLSAVRQWFWSRRSEAGFTLSGFPQTRLEALLLDEWLEARGEALTACLLCAPVGGSPLSDVAEHYGTQGLLVDLTRGDEAVAASGLLPLLESAA